MNKAGFIRKLIERERSREREQELLAMFNEAAADVADEGVGAAWAAEIERRARRVLSGESKGTDWTEARARIVSKVLPR